MFADPTPSSAMIFGRHHDGQQHLQPVLVSRAVSTNFLKLQGLYGRSTTAASFASAPTRDAFFQHEDYRLRYLAVEGDRLRRQSALEELEEAKERHRRRQLSIEAAERDARRAEADLALALRGVGEMRRNLAAAARRRLLYDVNAPSSSCFAASAPQQRHQVSTQAPHHVPQPRQYQRQRDGYDVRGDVRTVSPPVPSSARQSGPLDHRLSAAAAPIERCQHGIDVDGPPAASAQQPLPPRGSVPIKKRSFFQQHAASKVFCAATAAANDDHIATAAQQQQQPIAKKARTIAVPIASSSSSALPAVVSANMPPTQQKTPQQPKPQRKQKKATTASSSSSPRKDKAKLDDRWLDKFERLVAFKSEHGHTVVPRCHDDYKLALWVVEQRKQYRLRKLGKASNISEERIALLEGVGFVWNAQDSAWRNRFEQLKEYKQRQGHTMVPFADTEFPGLGMWVKEQRRHHAAILRENRGSSKPVAPMSSERVALLDSIGFTWDLQDHVWWASFRDLEMFKSTHGHCLVPTKRSENPKLGTWVHHQRRQKKLLAEGKGSYLTKERVDALERLGFDWSPRKKQ